MGYKDDKKIGPLCIKLAQMSGCVINLKKTKYIFFEIKINELLLQKCDKSWNNVSNIKNI